MLSRSISLFLVLAFVSSTACSNGSADTSSDILERAERAYVQLDLATARNLFEQAALADTVEAEDRATSYRELAWMAWRFDRDLDTARGLITAATRFETKLTDAHLAHAAIELQAGHPAAARLAAELALAAATSATERAAAGQMLARVTFKLAMLDDRPLAPRVISRADSVISAIAALQPGTPAIALARLPVALMVRNGPAAAQAVRSFYRLAAGETPENILGKRLDELLRTLANWNDRPLARRERIHLVGALARARFFEAATFVARHRALGDPIDDHPSVQEIIAYHAFLVDLGDIAERHYRDIAIGRKQGKAALDHDIEVRARALWPQLDWRAQPPAFDYAVFKSQIDRRFGGLLRTAGGGSYYSLYAGHKVIDEQRVVEQYGRKAELRFISLDAMASRGYTTWFWNGRQAVGGWAAHPTIYQIRSSYTAGPSRAWQRLVDPHERDEIAQRIAEESSGDDARAARNPHTYLPGMALRLRRDAYARVRDELAAQGLSGAELRLAFLAEIERRQIESSIFAHEGRHAIESQSPVNFIRRDAEREFLAKLSEVALATDPFLAILGGILNPNIGDRTSHGQANERIMKGLVKWMKGHAGEIVNLEKDRPMLPQLDRLEPRQLVAAIQSMDAMARNE